MKKDKEEFSFVIDEWREIEKNLTPEMLEALTKTYQDLMVFGKGTYFIANDGTCSHIPYNPEE